MIRFLRLAPFALLAGAVLATSAAALPPEKETWHRVDTESFVIYSNAGEKRAVTVGRDLERFTAGLDLLGGARMRPSGRTLVLHLWGKAVLRPCLPRIGDEVREVDGLFVGHSDGHVILLDAASEGDGRSLVQHELVHERLRLVMPGVPSWLNEGLAQFHQTFSATGNEIEIGHPIPHLVERLRRDHVLPLRELFATKDLLRDAWDEHPRFYATAWALTHYLRTKRPGGREGLATYLALLAGGGDRVESAWTAFATSEAALTAELEAHVASPALATVRITLDRQVADAKPAAAAVAPRAEVLVAIGTLLVRFDGGARCEEAGEHFRAAVALDAANATAVSGLADCAEHDGKAAEAVALHARAVALRPDDPHLLHAAARSRMAAEIRAGVPTDPTPEARERILAARALLARCVAIDPRNAGAQALLGLTYFLADSPPEPGIAALATASALLPSRADVAANLVGLLARAGRLPEAREALLRVGSLGDAARLSSARGHVLWATMNGAFQLAAEGDEVRAVALAERALAEGAGHADQAQLAQRLASLQTWARDKIASDALATANDHARAGRHVEALAVLEAIDVSTLKEPQLAAAIAQNRDELTRYLAAQPQRR